MRLRGRKDSNRFHVPPATALLCPEASISFLPVRYVRGRDMPDHIDQREVPARESRLGQPRLGSAIQITLRSQSPHDNHGPQLRLPHRIP
jgi:hypothetical protein